MERRVDKQAFAQILLKSVETGIFRDCDPKTMKIVSEGY